MPVDAYSTYTKDHTGGTFPASSGKVPLDALFSLTANCRFSIRITADLKHPGSIQFFFSIFILILHAV